MLTGADGGNSSLFSFIPFVVSAFFITVGLISSPTFKVQGVLFRPVWLPMIFLVIGLSVGLGIKVF